VIYFCAQRNRRTKVLLTLSLNGIDYLEVAETEQTVLLLTMLHDPAPLNLGPAQVEILGGESVTGIKTLNVAALPDAAKTLRIEVDRAGDFSTYTLLLRADDETDEPPLGVDPALARIDFSFKAGCPATNDCAPVSCCPPAAADRPDINYLAKDYPGFVQVMLDRIAVLAPDWRERHAADLGVTLVELLAYVADHLSYRQDAVATEAYLGTARSRISLRRHARLVDYRVDEGENARCWVQFKIQKDREGVLLPARTLVLPRIAGLTAQLDPHAAATQAALNQGGVVFATLKDPTLSADFNMDLSANLGASLNQISFHTWSDDACCLPAGATSATLKGHLTSLKAGDVLLFEEVLGPLTGVPEDADRTHRWAVRLTRVHHTDRFHNAVIDPVTGEAVTDIEWEAADALPFALCISSVTDKEHNPRLIPDVSVARGNMVAADHGKWPQPGPNEWEPLGTVPAPPAAPVTTNVADCCTPAGSIVAPLPVFFPALASSPLTFARDFDATAPASALGAAAPPDVAAPKPQIEVLDDQDAEWSPEPDLLSFDKLHLGFVVEIENDGTAHLRFGDDQHGAAPPANASFRARYRIGNGTPGNLGSDTIAHVVTADSRIISVRNPLPAAGGRDPDTMETIRQLAPSRFRTQARAVTEEDYGAAASHYPGVRAARGTLRWTGSWRTAFVALDAAPRAPSPAMLAATIATQLDLMRMAGVDLATEPAAIVGLRIALSVCVKPHYATGEVEQALRRVFTAGVTCEGTPGLLDPANFSFGQTVYLSPFIAAAQAVDGVAAVRATAFQRVADPANDATGIGYITMQRLEIPRLDNDPSRPDRGFLELTVDAG
jgi:hypothetical protein